MRGASLERELKQSRKCQLGHATQRPHRPSRRFQRDRGPARRLGPTSVFSILSHRVARKVVWIKNINPSVRICRATPLHPRQARLALTLAIAMTVARNKSNSISCAAISAKSAPVSSGGSSTCGTWNAASSSIFATRTTTGVRRRQVRIGTRGTEASRAFRKPARADPSFAPPRNRRATKSSTISRSQQIAASQATSHGAAGGANATTAETSGSAAPL